MDGSRRPPRVVYCTDTYPPQVNGVSVVTALSVDGLTRRGWECAVVAPAYPHGHGVGAGGDRGPELQRLSIPSAALPVYPDVRVALPSYGAVADLVRRFRPDLVHCATEAVIGRLGQVVAARHGVPCVSSYHTDFGRYAAAYGLPWLAGRVNAYLARFHRRSRRTFTPSTWASRGLESMGVRTAEVWGRGVDTSLFRPDRRDAELRHHFGMDSRFTFLYVGRFAAEKGVERILEAYRLASARVPAGVMQLVLAGTGPREPALRRAAPPGVHFLGHLDRRSTLPDLYANADAFVFASHTETLGLVILEAMSSGLPVVAAPAGGVGDHVVEGVNALTYSPGDTGAMANAMLRLVDSPFLARELGDGARRTALALDWEVELDRLDASYRDVCGLPAPARAAA